MDLTNYKSTQYVWNIKFNIYWRWITADEIIEIQDKLWELCIWNALTPENALWQVNSKLVELWNASNIDTYSTMNLIWVEELINNINDEFWWLNNYKKTIRTFEIYRILKEWNACNL